MEYNATRSTQTIYRTAEGDWLKESYHVVHSTSEQHRHRVSSSVSENVLAPILRERFQQTRNLSDGQLKKSHDQGFGPGWHGRDPDLRHDHKNSGLLSQMQRKWSGNIGHYSSKLYDFAAASIFPKDHGSQYRPRQNIGNDDFEVIEKHELANLYDEQHLGNGTANGDKSSLTHGHRFVPVSLKAPNWCDKCGGFIWGMYKHCYICINCRYTCHLKCRPAVTLDCIVKADSGSVVEEETSETSFSDGSTELDTEDDSGYFTCLSTTSRSFDSCDQRSSNWSREKLKKRIEDFNKNNHGLQMNLDRFEDSDTFQGGIRVHMNLIRPITMLVSSSLPSAYHTLTHDTENDNEDETGNVMSFYLPRNTSKVIHISSSTTAQEVIRALLSKFNITDNPRKFALYEKNLGNRKTGMMRRMAEDELPLAIALSWTFAGVEQLDSNMFILQENDTGEILWDAFSLPELESFLLVLNREEEEHVDQVKEKYRLFRIQLQNQLKRKEPEEGRRSTGRRVPVFV